MDSTSEAEYAGEGKQNGAMPAKLGSKEGTNRDGTRGASDDVVDQGQVKREQPGYAFFGDGNGRNDVGNDPVDKGHTDSTLNAPRRSGSTDAIKGGGQY